MYTVHVICVFKYACASVKYKYMYVLEANIHVHVQYMYMYMHVYCTVCVYGTLGRGCDMRSGILLRLRSS